MDAFPAYMTSISRILFWLLFTSAYAQTSMSNWDRWWSYRSGMNGPAYWGHAHPEYRLCKLGNQQSPINIEPTRLLFDPNLKHLKIDTSMIRGMLKNTGHDITLEIKNDGYNFVNISVGPLSYTYRVSEIKFHLSNSDTVGSEHTVSGKSFPVEVRRLFAQLLEAEMPANGYKIYFKKLLASKMHIIAYNSDLYRNLTEASKSVKGLAIIAVFMEIGSRHDKFLYSIFRELRAIPHKGNLTHVNDVSFSHVIPNTTEYVTYEGSLTQPGCYETVTWILLNKPLWIAKEQLADLRIIFNTKENEPHLQLESNVRPIMPLNHRVVRTNINSHKRTRLCTFEKEMFYQVNTRYNKT